MSEIVQLVLLLLSVSATIVSGACPSTPVTSLSPGTSLFSSCTDPSLTLSFGAVPPGVRIILERFDINGIALPSNISLSNVVIEVRDSTMRGESSVACSMTDSNISFIDVRRSVASGESLIHLESSTNLSGVNHLSLERVAFTNPTADVVFGAVKFPLRNHFPMGFTTGSLRVNLDSISAELDDGATEMDSVILVYWDRGIRDPVFEITGFQLTISNLTFNTRSYNTSRIYQFHGLSMRDSQLVLRDSNVTSKLMPRVDSTYKNDNMMSFSSGHFVTSLLLIERISMRFLLLKRSGANRVLSMLRGTDVNFTSSLVALLSSDIEIENQVDSAFAIRFRAYASSALSPMSWLDTQFMIHNSTVKLTTTDLSIVFDTFRFVGRNVTVSLRDIHAPVVVRAIASACRVDDSACSGCSISADNVTMDARSVLMTESLSLVFFGNSSMKNSRIDLSDSTAHCVDDGIPFNVFLACNTFSTYDKTSLGHSTVNLRGMALLGRALAFGLIYSNQSGWNEVNFTLENSKAEGKGLGTTSAFSFLETAITDSTIVSKSVFLNTTCYLHIAAWLIVLGHSRVDNVTFESTDTRGIIRAEQDLLVLAFLQAAGGDLLFSLISRAPSLTAAWIVVDDHSTIRNSAISGRSTQLQLEGADSSVVFETVMVSSVEATNITLENCRFEVTNGISGLAAGFYFRNRSGAVSSKVRLKDTSVLLNVRNGGYGSTLLLANKSATLRDVTFTVEGGVLLSASGNVSAIVSLHDTEVDTVNASFSSSTVMVANSRQAAGLLLTPRASGRSVLSVQLPGTSLTVDATEGDATLVKISGTAGSSFSVQVQDLSAAFSSVDGTVRLLELNGTFMSTSSVVLNDITAQLNGISTAVVSLASQQAPTIAIRQTQVSPMSTTRGSYTLLEVDSPPTSPATRPILSLENITLSGDAPWTFATGPKLEATIHSSCVGIEGRALLRRERATAFLDDPSSHFVYTPLSLERQEEVCRFERTPSASPSQSLSAVPPVTRTPPMTMSNESSPSLTASAAGLTLDCGPVALQVSSSAGVSDGQLEAVGDTDLASSAEVPGSDVATQGLTVVLLLTNSATATWSSFGSDGVAVRCESDDTDAEKECSEYIRTKRQNATDATVSWDPRHVVAVTFTADASLELFADVWIVLQPMSASLGCDLGPSGIGEARVRVTTAVPADVESQAAAATLAAAAGAAAGALGSPAAAMDAQALAVFSLISCGSPGDRYAMKSATFLLSPVSLGGGPEGNIAFNMMMMALLMVVPLVLSVAWHWFKQRVLGRESSLVELHMMLRYPSLSVKLAMLFHQGTAILSLRLVFDGRASAASVIGMAVALVFPWAMYAYGRVLTRPGFDSDVSGRMVFFKYDGIAERIPAMLRVVVMSIFVPVGKWGPGEMSKRFGGTVSSTMPLWTLYGSLPLFQASAVCVVAAVHTGSRTGCMVQFGTLMLMNVLFGLAVCVARPYRSGFLVIGQAASSFALVVILGLMAALAVDPERRHEREASTHLMRLMGVTGLLRMIYSFTLLGVEPVLLHTFLTKQEWRELRDAPETKDLYRQLFLDSTFSLSEPLADKPKKLKKPRERKSILDTPTLRGMPEETFHPCLDNASISTIPVEMKPVATRTPLHILQDSENAPGKRAGSEYQVAV